MRADETPDIFAKNSANVYLDIYLKPEVRVVFCDSY